MSVGRGSLPVTAGWEGKCLGSRLEEHFLHEPGHHLLRPLRAGEGGHLALQVLVAARLAFSPAEIRKNSDDIKHS